MSPIQAKNLAREMKKNGKSLQEIASVLTERGYKTTRGTSASISTVAYMCPPSYRKKKKADTTPPPISSIGSVSQKFRIVQAILKSNDMKAEDRIAAALFML